MTVSLQFSGFRDFHSGLNFNDFGIVLPAVASAFVVSANSKTIFRLLWRDSQNRERTVLKIDIFGYSEGV